MSRDRICQFHHITDDSVITSSAQEHIFGTDVLAGGFTIIPFSLGSYFLRRLLGKLYNSTMSAGLIYCRAPTRQALRSLHHFTH